MLTIESELTAAIYILYAVDCVHWLEPGQMAIVRRLGKGWGSRPFREDSYTLLGRMPVFVNPIDLRPSCMSGAIEDLHKVEQSPAATVLQCAPDTTVITALAYVGAFNMLVFVPALLITGYLSTLWRVPLTLLLWTQLSLGWAVVAKGRAWRRASSGDFWRQFVSIHLNPLAALRSGDVLLQGSIAAGVHKTAKG